MPSYPQTSTNRLYLPARFHRVPERLLASGRHFFVVLPPQPAWNLGRQDAASICRSSQIDPEFYDFDAIFADPEVDMMRPHGGGLYPGVHLKDDSDRSSLPTSDTQTAEAQVREGTRCAATFYMLSHIV